MFLGLGDDCLGLVVRFVRHLPEGGGASLLAVRLVCKPLRDLVDANRTHLTICPAMMQQHIALERFASNPSYFEVATLASAHVSTNAHQRQPCSAVVRALQRWSHVPAVTAIGHLPRPWIPQLLNLVTAECQVPLLHDLIFSKLTWRHADARVAAAMLHVSRFTFAVETVVQGAMPAAEAMALVQQEAAAASSSLGAWVSELEGKTGYMPHNCLTHLQWLLHTLTSCLIYQGDYSTAKSVMDMRLQPWETGLRGADAMRATWTRESLVLVQLARRQYNGAVEVLLASPSWARIAAAGRLLADALRGGRLRHLRRRVLAYLAAGQQQQPQDHADWVAELAVRNRKGRLERALTGDAQRAMADGGAAGTPDDVVHEHVVRACQAFIKAVAAGQPREAVLALLDPGLDISLDYVPTLIGLHLLPSLGVHELSVGTQQQQEALHQLAVTAGEAAGRNLGRADRSGKTSVLLSFLSGMALNRGALTAVVPDALRGAPLPEPVGVLQDACALLGANMHLARGAAACPLTEFCAQELSLTMAAAAPDAQPAYAILPQSAQLLEQLRQHGPGCASLRRWCELAPALQQPAQPDQAPPAAAWGTQACWEVMYAVEDLYAAAAALTSAPAGPEPALALEALGVQLLDAMRSPGADRKAAANYALDCSQALATVLAAYGCAEAASGVARRVADRFQGQPNNSYLAYEVVWCLGKVAKLSGWGGCSAPPPGSQQQQRAAGPGPAPAPAEGAVVYDSRGIVNTCRLLTVLPAAERYWLSLEYQVLACAEVLGLLLPHTAAFERLGGYKAAGQLVRRMLFVDGAAAPAGPPAWAHSQQKRVAAILRFCDRCGEAAQQLAFTRLVQLLRGALLPRWPQSLAVLMGGALEHAPLWACAPPLLKLWCCWERGDGGGGDGRGGDELGHWEAFAGAFKERFGASAAVPLSQKDVQRMTTAVRAAPGAAWGCGGMTPASPPSGSGGGGGANGGASKHLAWMLRMLMSSWAAAPGGADAAQTWAESLVREAFKAWGCAAHARAVATLVADHAKLWGLMNVAHAAAQVAPGAP